MGALRGNSSSACTSTESKRSRIRNRKTPITMKATRTENATLISTTSGMPLAPAAARMSPFSSDMNPMIWLTALRRVTIISRPSSTTERAKRQILARERIGLSGRAQHDDHRQGDESDAQQHGGADAADRLDRAVDAELHHDPMQRHRNDDGLEHERDGSRDVEMRRVLDVGLPSDTKARARRRAARRR